MSKSSWKRFIVILTVLFIISGCSNLKSVPQSKAGVQNKKEINPKMNILESDEDLTKQLEAETGIEEAMVQIVEGRAVNVDIIINNQQVLSPDKVIEKYSSVINEKYPDKTIDIIIAKGGKLLKQTTLK